MNEIFSFDKSFLKEYSQCLVLKSFVLGVCLMSSLASCLGVQQQLVSSMKTTLQEDTKILEGVNDRKTADEASVKIKHNMVQLSNNVAEDFVMGKKSALRLFFSSLLPVSTSGVKRASDNCAVQVERLEKVHCYGSKSLQKIFRENIILQK